MASLVVDVEIFPASALPARVAGAHLLLPGFTPFSMPAWTPAMCATISQGPQ